jgi:hypothetical protein
MIEWWMLESPDYFEVGTCVLSANGKADPMKYYHTRDRDIVYEGLFVDMVIAYMAVTKAEATKEGAVAKIYSYEHMQKIHDAVLFGARTSQEGSTVIIMLQTLAVMAKLTRKVLIQSAFPSSV